MTCLPVCRSACPYVFFSAFHFPCPSPAPAPVRKTVCVSASTLGSAVYPPNPRSRTFSKLGPLPFRAFGAFCISSQSRHPLPPIASHSLHSILSGHLNLGPKTISFSWLS
eukprot:RCo012807